MRPLLPAIALLLLWAWPAHSQQPAPAAKDPAAARRARQLPARILQSKVQVRGEVVDPNGARLPGVTVKAEPEDAGDGGATISDAEGSFRLLLLPGRYTFRALGRGFPERVIRGFQVAVAAEPRLTITMRRGETAKPPPIKPGPPPPPPPPPPPVDPPVTLPGPDPPPSPASQATLTWNMWAESGPAPGYNPALTLKPDTSYLLVLHLSAFGYVVSGVTAEPAGAAATDWMDDFLKTAAPAAPLRVLMLPDTSFFSLVGPRASTLTVDVNAVRNWVAAASHPAVPAPLPAVRDARLKGQLPPFVFGEIALRFRTTAREGVGAIALSIWTDEGRPLDEIAATFCVSSAATAPALCTGRAPIAPTLRGVDAVRVAADGDTPPDAALHFVELPGLSVMGVFRDNRCADCEFVVWDLGRSGAELRKHLEATTLPAFSPDASADSLPDAGRGLFNVLFPDDGNPVQVTARAAFARFVGQELARGGPATSPPSIFVRAVLAGEGAGTDPLYLPVGLLTVPGRPGEFVGFYFRVESPLERQTYRATKACVSRWVLTLPRAGSQDVLGKAREHSSGLVTAFQPQAQHLFEDIPPLRAWLADEAAAPDSTAVVVLSHNDRDKLFFQANQVVTSDEVQRRFGEGSLLVLNGCSTASPLAVDLLKKFNQRGMAAAIASYVPIRPELAGDFLTALSAVTAEGDATGLSLADVFFRTVQKVRTLKAEPTASAYGPRALVFSLLGNSGLRLCVPTKQP